MVVELRSASTITRSTSMNSPTSGGMLMLAVRLTMR
jgi:hypothetical protein